ncbi:hypothetical protein ZWY2020_028824 [Hordeum vulgare]|nr:hypothetical protein ZWY2020_028824 [Hordeum vulgare]
MLGVASIGAACSRSEYIPTQDFRGQEKGRRKGGPVSFPQHRRGEGREISGGRWGFDFPWAMDMALRAQTPLCSRSRPVLLVRAAAIPGLAHVRLLCSFWLRSPSPPPPP